MARDPHYTIRFPGGPDDRAARALQRYQDGHGRPPPAVLDVACRNDHRLARVVRTDEGLVLTGRFTAVELTRTGPDLYDVTRQHGKPLSTQVAVLLDPATDQQGVTVGCRCMLEVTIPVGWLRAQLQGRRRRAVYTTGS